MTRVSRRRFLQLMGAVAGATALSGCGSTYGRLAGGPAAPPPSLPNSARDFALLNRLTYGPRYDDRVHMAEIGPAAWIEEQLAPDRLDDGACELRLRPLDSLTMDGAAIFDIYGDQLFDDQDRESAPGQLRRGTLLRQIYSRRQLYEIMVEFWSDHFHISVEKGDCFFLKTVDDREVIRPYALGRFRDLLQASVRSPAMLVYLDNQANGKEHPNENYARELLELHTLGVDGGYAQSDVMELARCLTGWSVKERFQRGQFTFLADQHDFEEKQILGHAIAPAGEAEMEQVVDLLAGHESTAWFIATKLVRRFFGEPVPTEQVTNVARTFQETGGEILALLRTLLLDGIAGERLSRPQYKRPINFVVSALRQAHAETDGGDEIQRYLGRMGQMPFAWPTPDGFPDRDEEWFGNLLPRWQFALALSQDRLPGTHVPIADLTGGDPTIPRRLERVCKLFLGAGLTQPSRKKISSILGRAQAEFDVDQVLTAGILASPAFQWR